MAHLTYFDDFEDLERKLENTNFTAIHNLMVVENQRREEALRQNWCYVYSKIKPDLKVPQNLYGTIFFMHIAVVRKWVRVRWDRCINMLQQGFLQWPGGHTTKQLCTKR